MTDQIQPWLIKSIVARHLRLLHVYGLVQWSSGNISARCGDQIVIKPSGIPYHSGDLMWSDMVIVSMDGKPSGSRKPSVDTPIHLGVYRRRPDVNAIVHTHSTYATAFAAAGECIPVITTMAADVFGGAIPCGEGLLTDQGDIASAIVWATTRSPAMLLQAHGVFTVGKTVAEAVKAAVLVEEVAKVAFLARQLGHVKPLPADVVAELHKRYKEGYGQ